MLGLRALAEVIVVGIGQSALMLVTCDFVFTQDGAVIAYFA